MGGRLPDRVSVFIDYENAVRVARNVFAHTVTGRIDPHKLSRWLAGPERDLTGVHLYRGEPSWQRSPLAWANFDRDVKRWMAMGAYVTTIPVQYGHNGIAREKGIDVALAIDVITRAVHQEFEVAVIVSNDRDLSPVVKALAEGTRGVRVEVASWVGGGGSDEVALHAPRVRGHRMDRAIYEQVAGSWDDGSPPASLPTRLDSTATSAAPGRTEPSTPGTARIQSAPRGAMAQAFIAAGLVRPGLTASEADSATSSA